MLSRCGYCPWAWPCALGEQTCWLKSRRLKFGPALVPKLRKQHCCVCSLAADAVRRRFFASYLARSIFFVSSPSLVISSSPTYVLVDCVPIVTIGDFYQLLWPIEQGLTFLKDAFYWSLRNMLQSGFQFLFKLLLGNSSSRNRSSCGWCLRWCSVFVSLVSPRLVAGGKGPSPWQSLLPWIFAPPQAGWDAVPML